MYIIVKGKNSWKGKSVTEMAQNLKKEGYPAEVDRSTLDRMRYIEKKHGPDVFKK
jgi:hypothetical protein